MHKESHKVLSEELHIMLTQTAEQLFEIQTFSKAHVGAEGWL
jgi:hypothetical protein